MGLKLPSPTATPFRRVVTGAVLAFGLLSLTGCGGPSRDEWLRVAMPEPASEQAPANLALWQWGWVAAMIIGVLVWGLMFYVAVRFRRRNDNDVPVQTRYNLPLEIFYTIAPVLMVVVFFYWTIHVQDRMLDPEKKPDLVVDVVGQQWSWTFNYTEQGTGGTTPFTSGTASEIPTLVLPVDKTVEFKLHSPDVIHSFGIPAFLMKMDVIPGRVNHFPVTPTKTGTYAGKCYELCGVYHSRMLFNVKVVSQQEYAAYLATLQKEGQVADAPVLGNQEFTNDPTGLVTTEAEGDQK